MPQFSIYRIRLSGSELAYIGYTSTSPERALEFARRDAVDSSRSTPLLNAIREHGGDSFVSELLEVVHGERDEAERRKLELIRELQPSLNRKQRSTSPSGSNPERKGQSGELSEFERRMLRRLYAKVFGRKSYSGKDGGGGQEEAQAA